jgi:regulator of protease activity HflC (stomatin/prohibitin superfamily)
MFLLVAMVYILVFITFAILVVPSAILKRLIPPVIVNNKWKMVLPIFLLAFVGVQLDNIFFYAEAGHSYFVQYKTGGQRAVINAPGPTLKWYGEVIDFKAVNTVKYTTSKEQEMTTEGKQGTMSAIVPPVGIRFNDAVNADVSFTARFRLPTDKIKFKKMAKEFRSQDNLIKSIQIPIGREIARNAGRMYSAQEYISGKGGDFENYIDDQMRHGIIMLDTKEERVGDKDESVVDSTQRKISDKRSIRYTVTPRTDSTGAFIRKSHGLTEYGIEVAQVTVENVEPEDKFKEMLARQRDAAAEASIEKQTTQKAEYKKQRIIAEGETEKATIRINKEKEQIDILISGETQKKQAQLTLETNDIELKAARLQAQTTKELADAEAYQKAKIYKADGALEKKLKAYVAVNAKYATALENTKARLVPETVIGGTSGGKGGSGDATALIDMLTAKTAKDLALDITSN